MIPAVPPQPPLPSPAILQVRIGPFDRITLAGVPYGNAKAVDGVGYSLSRLDVSPPITETFSHAQLHLERAKPDYAFDRNWFAPEKAATRERTSIERLADLDDDELPKVMWKLEWVTRFLKREVDGKITRSDDAMEAAILEVHSEVIALDVAKTRVSQGTKKRRAGSATKLREPPCVKTWREWVLAYERADLDPCSLRDNTHGSGNRNSKIDIKIAVLMWKHAVRYAAPNRPKKKHLYKDLCKEIDELPENVQAASEDKPLPCPSDKAFYKVISKLDKYDVYAGRYGVSAAKRRFVMVSTGLDVTRPGQRIEIDEWQVSLMVLLNDTGLWEHLTPEQQAEAKPLRMWLCVAIDCATRCILGMRLAQTASSANVIAVLRMVVSDKSNYASAVGAITPWDMYLSPESIASDSGSSFIADITQATIIDLTGAPKIPPVGLPHLRARIERMFGTVHTALISRFHGRTFENTVALGDYQPGAMASLNVDELAWVMVRFVVDAYHNMPHAGLGGETPRNAWLRLTKMFHVNEPPDRNKMRAIFGIALTRKIRAGGIWVLGLNYNSEHLEAHRRRIGDGVELEVRLDAEDIGAISVRVGKDWLTVPCVRTGFDRITVRVWTVTLADLGRRFTREARVAEPVVREAIRAIQQVSDDAIACSGIGTLIDTPEDIDRAERNLAISFSWAKPNPDISSSGDGLFANVFPAGDDAPASTESFLDAPSMDSKNVSARKHRMED
jgi:putative transposase